MLTFWPSYSWLLRISGAMLAEPFWSAELVFLRNLKSHCGWLSCGWRGTLNSLRAEVVLVGDSKEPFWS